MKHSGGSIGILDGDIDNCHVGVAVGKFVVGIFDGDTVKIAKGKGEGYSVGNGVGYNVLGEFVGYHVNFIEGIEL
jgi:hypothetical protein